jgi:Tfp pilus assembly protein PilN
VIIDPRAWRRLLPIWLPAVLLAAASVALYVWQTSDRVGRAAQLENQVDALEAEIVRLEGLREQAAAERRLVEEVEAEFQRLYGDVFGRLDERLTRIMRAIYSATRDAGLNPGSYAYKLDDRDLSGAQRLTISFAVAGEYPQVRQMLAALQASSEFLVVDSIQFSGEADAVTSRLAITVRVSTFLTEADPEQLRRLTGAVTGVAPAGGDGGSD